MFSYDLTDKIIVDAGIRYSYEEKEIDYTVSWNGPAPPGAPLQDEEDYEDVTPNLVFNIGQFRRAFICYCQ